MRFEAKKGFSTILLIIIVSAISLSIIVGLFELSFHSTRLSYEAEIGAKVRAYANTCTEKALYLFSQPGFTPDDIETTLDDIQIGDGNCSVIEIEDLNVGVEEDHYLMKVEGKIGEEITRKVEVFLKTTDDGDTYQYKWIEVDDFNNVDDYNL